MNEDTFVINAEFPEKMVAPLTTPARYKVFYGGRGGSKSWSIARYLLLQGFDRSLRILCVREFMSSVSDSVHRTLSDQISELGLQHHYTVEKAGIYGNNGTEFRFAGIRNNVTAIKSFEGIDVCWCEEASNITKNSWSVLIPTIRKEDSEIIISFNPELESDETYQRFVVNPPPNASVTKINFDDNPWFPQVLKEEAEYMRRNDPDSYHNVYLGFPKVFMENAIYGKELRIAAEQGRIGRVQYDPTVAVNTYWDLGRADSTAIIFAQFVGGEYHIIDYIEETGLVINDYLRMLQLKPYIYGADHLPHDAKALMLGTRMSIQELMKQNGRNVKIVPKLSLVDGINAVRTIFCRLWIDQTRCTDLIQSLRKYRYDMTQARPEPVHDDSSHAGDALRYLAICLRGPKAAPILPRSQIIGRPAGWMG